MLPSFFSSTADAGAYELKWDGQQYSLTLTDTNGVLSDYTFSSSTTGLNFSVDGNQLTITSAQFGRTELLAAVNRTLPPTGKPFPTRW